MQKQLEANEVLFNKLKSAKHTTDYQPSLFGDTKEPRYTEYWSLTDLRGLIDLSKIPSNLVPNWHNIYKIISAETPRYLLDSLGDETTEWWHDQFHKDKNEGTELSPYASWTLMKFAGNYMDTSFQQSYFLDTKKSFPDIDAFADKILRTQKRRELKQANSYLKSAIASSKANYEDFYNMMYTELFQSALANPAVQNKKPFMDHMNIPLLAFYTKALCQIVSRWKNSSAQDERTLRYIAAQEIKILRSNLPGGCPENYLVNIDATKISKEVEQRENDFINHNIGIAQSR